MLHPVSDLATAKQMYAALLGVAPQTDDAYYVGFEVAGQHIGLVPGGGPQGMTSPVAYWHVGDIEAKLAEVTAAGGTVKEPHTTSAAGAWWPRSPTPTATSSGCYRTRELMSFWSGSWSFLRPTSGPRRSTTMGGTGRAKVMTIAATRLTAASTTNGTV